MKKNKKVNEIWNSNTYDWNEEEMKREYEESYGETPNEEELYKFIEKCSCIC